MNRPSCSTDSEPGFCPTPVWKQSHAVATFPFALILILFLGFVSSLSAQTTLNPSALSFGNVAVGVASGSKTATLKNTQTVALTISSITISGGTAPSDFAWTGTCPLSPATLGAGQRCRINVTFTPTALGSRTAVLTVTHSASTSPQSVSLSGTGTNPVTLAPSPLAFGNVAQGTTSPNKTETLTNLQSGPLTISSIGVTGNFLQTGGTCALSPATLAAGGSCTILIAFAPTALGAVAGTLTVSDDAPISPQTANLTGTGIVAVTLSTTSLGFGNVVAGNTSASQSVSLTNHKTSALNFTSIAATGDFAIASNTCGTSIAAGATCTVGITFSPTAIGARAGTLTYTDDAVNSPQTVSLAGTGTTPVTLSTSSLSFGNGVVGNTSASQPVTLTNLKSSAVNFSSIAASANFSVVSNTCGASVKATSTCTVGVAFVPSTLGPLAGSLTFNDDALNSPQTVTLGGTGTPAVTLSTTTLTYTARTVGTTSPAQNVVLTNNLASTLAISSVAATGDFAVASNTCGTSVIAGANCTIAVTFTPTTSGTRTGTLSINDSAFGSPQQVGLTGSGTGAVLVSLAVTPANPSVAIGTPQQFTATGTYGDGSKQDLTSSATWSSSTTSVATINAAGLANAVSVGNTTIQAASGTINGSTTLSVVSTITVAVSPQTASVQAGSGSQKFTATVGNDAQNGGVNWGLSGSGCSGATCGTLSSSSRASGVAVTYTAPTTAPAPPTVTLTATSISDPSRSNSATISITVAHIVMQQATVPASDTTTQFTLTPSYNGGAAIALVNGGANDSGNLAPGAYSVVGNAPTGWDLTGLTCSSSLGTSTSTTALNTGTASINLAAGDTVTCKYTDTQRGNIVVQEVTVPGTDTTTQFTFTPSGYESNTNFALVNNGSNDSGPLVPGSYSVAELAQSGWVLTNLLCSITKTGAGTSTFVTTNSPTASINLAACDTGTCVYTTTSSSLVNTTPKGTTFTESFGDSSTLCWTGGPSSCDQLWVVAKGAGQSIVPTPGTPPQNTASSNSLQMIETAGSNAFIYTAGTFPRMPSGTAFDLYLTLNVASQSMKAFDITRLITASSTSDGTEYPAQISFRYDGTHFQLLAAGSTSAPPVTIALNSWHSLQLHVDSGTSASYLIVDGGAQNTFTENAKDFAEVVVGTAGGNFDAMTYYVGNVYVNSPLGGGPPPSMYLDFESSTDGTTITPSILAASTHCGNGLWSLTTNPITGMTISTDAQKQLHSPVTTCGTQYTDTTGTRGLRYDISQTSRYAAYAWATPASSASVGFFFKIGVTDTNYYSAFAIVAGGGDYAVLHIRGGAIYIETWTGTTTPIPISQDTWYWVTIQYNAGGTHHLQVYETAGWTLLGTASNAANGNFKPTGIEIGRTGSESGFPSAYWYYDNVVVDYLNGTFPILP